MDLSGRDGHEVGIGRSVGHLPEVTEDPVVNSPRDALHTLIKTGARYLFLENLLVENPAARDLKNA